MLASTDSEVKHVMIPIADGSEEMEVVIVADVLRRSGATVTIVSVEHQLEVMGMNKIKIVADSFLESSFILDGKSSRYPVFV